MASRGPFRGEPAQGLALGEWGGDPRVYSSLPTAEELTGDQPFQKGLRPPGGYSQPGKMSGTSILKEKDLVPVRNVREIARVARARLVILGLQQLRLDVPLPQRIDILLWNMSTQIVWVNFTQQSTAVGLGIPLPAVSAAGQYDGGSFAWEVKEDVQFWGVAAAAGNNEVLVVEGAR